MADATQTAAAAGTALVEEAKAATYPEKVQRMITERQDYMAQYTTEGYTAESPGYIGAAIQTWQGEIGLLQPILAEKTAEREQRFQAIQSVYHEYEQAKARGDAQATQAQMAKLGEYGVVKPASPLAFFNTDTAVTQTRYLAERNNLSTIQGKALLDMMYSFNFETIQQIPVGGLIGSDQGTHVEPVTSSTPTPPSGAVVPGIGGAPFGSIAYNEVYGVQKDAGGNIIPGTDTLGLTGKYYDAGGRKWELQAGTVVSGKPSPEARDTGFEYGSELWYKNQIYLKEEAAVKNKLQDAIPGLSTFARAVEQPQPYALNNMRIAQESEWAPLTGNLTKPPAQSDVRRLMDNVYQGTFYVPEGEYAQRQVKGTMVTDPIFGAYQIYNEKGRAISGGGSYALQSGMFSQQPMSTVVYGREGPSLLSIPAYSNVAQGDLLKAIGDKSAIEKYSRLGAEPYFGAVMPLQTYRKVTAMQGAGMYPEAMGNMAAAVDWVWSKGNKGEMPDIRQASSPEKGGQYKPLIFSNTLPENLFGGKLPSGQTEGVGTPELMGLPAINIPSILPVPGFGGGGIWEMTRGKTDNLPIFTKTTDYMGVSTVGLGRPKATTEPQGSSAVFDLSFGLVPPASASLQSGQTTFKGGGMQITIPESFNKLGTSEWTSEEKRGFELSKAGGAWMGLIDAAAGAATLGLLNFDRPIIEPQRTQIDVGFQRSNLEMTVLSAEGTRLMEYGNQTYPIDRATGKFIIDTTKPADIAFSQKLTDFSTKVDVAEQGRQSLLTEAMGGGYYTQNQQGNFVSTGKGVYPRGELSKWGEGASKQLMGLYGTSSGQIETLRKDAENTPITLGPISDPLGSLRWKLGVGVATTFVSKPEEIVVAGVSSGMMGAELRVVGLAVGTTRVPGYLATKAVTSPLLVKGVQYVPHAILGGAFVYGEAGAVTKGFTDIRPSAMATEFGGTLPSVGVGLGTFGMGYYGPEMVQGTKIGLVSGYKIGQETFRTKPAAMLETVNIRDIYIEENPLSVSDQSMKIKSTTTEELFLRPKVLGVEAPRFFEPRSTGAPKVVSSSVTADLPTYSRDLLVGQEPPKFGDLYAREYEVTRTFAGEKIQTEKITIPSDLILEGKRTYLLPDNARSLVNRNFRSTGGVAEFPIYEETVPITGERVTFGAFAEDRPDLMATVMRKYSTKTTAYGALEEGVTIKNVFERGTTFEQTGDLVGEVKVRKISDISPYVLGVDQITVTPSTRNAPMTINEQSITRKFTENPYLGKGQAKGMPTYDVDIGRVQSRKISTPTVYTIERISEPSITRPSQPSIISEFDYTQQGASKEINRMLGTKPGKKGEWIIGEEQVTVQGAMDRLAIAHDLGANIKTKPIVEPTKGTTKSKFPVGPDWMRTPLSDTFSSTSGRAVSQRAEAVSKPELSYAEWFKGKGYENPSGMTAELKPIQKEAFVYQGQQASRPTVLGELGGGATMAYLNPWGRKAQYTEDETLFVSPKAAEMIRQKTGQSPISDQISASLSATAPALSFQMMNVFKPESRPQRQQPFNANLLSLSPISVLALGTRSAFGQTTAQRSAQASIQVVEVVPLQTTEQTSRQMTGQITGLTTQQITKQTTTTTPKILVPGIPFVPIIGIPFLPSGVGGGVPSDRRGMFAFTEHSPTITPAEMGRSLFTGRYVQPRPQRQPIIKYVKQPTLVQQPSVRSAFSPVASTHHSSTFMQSSEATKMKDLYGIGGVLKPSRTRLQTPQLKTQHNIGGVLKLSPRRNVQRARPSVSMRGITIFKATPKKGKKGR